MARPKASKHSPKSNLSRRFHTVKTCPCVPCARKRARLIKLHKALHSRWTHVLVFLSVAIGLTALGSYKWIESLPAGAVVTKSVELLGEIIADRMLPDTLLRG
jgi:hypothetical protein